MTGQPEHAGVDRRIDADIPPPGVFIAATVHLAMMSSAQRHGEFIAHLAAQRPALRKPEVVGI
jgi:hypothetical protein